jgi:hypothetical protein
VLLSQRASLNCTSSHASRAVAIAIRMLMLAWPNIHIPPAATPNAGRTALDIACLQQWSDRELTEGFGLDALGQCVQLGAANVRQPVDGAHTYTGAGGGHSARFRTEFCTLGFPKVLEDVIGPHACSLEASKRVANSIPLERPRAMTSQY